MYVVTGGSGFIGSHVARALLRRGEQVHVIDPHPPRKSYGSAYSITQTDKPSEEVKRILKDVTAVIHMGGICSTTEEDWEKLRFHNIDEPRRLMEVCASLHVPFVYASSASVYGDAPYGWGEDVPEAYRTHALAGSSKYARSKIALDLEALRAKAWPMFWYGLRFFNVYGPGEEHKGPQMSMISKWVQAVGNGEPIGLFIGSQKAKRDFVHVSDCVSVILWLLDNVPAKGIYNVGTSVATPLFDAAMCCVDHVGERVVPIEMPKEIARQYQWFTQADIGKLRRAGYNQPFLTLKEGVQLY